MSIELRFLQKAIEDKNFLSFSYHKKSYKKIKAYSIVNNILKCDIAEFEIKDIKKIVILKEKF